MNGDGLSVDGKEEGKGTPDGFVLCELTSLDELSFPTNGSRKIKYTCVSVSSQLLVVGTSTGTIYVFARYASRHRPRSVSLPLHVYTTKDGPVNKLAIGPSEQLVAVGSESGRVSVLSVSSQSAVPQNALIYSVPGDARKPDGVTDICWWEESCVVAAHSSGIIAAHRIATRRNVFRSGVEVLLRLESEPVQLSVRGHLLLVSTTASSLILDFTNNTHVQVGKKTRNARMGACWMGSEVDEANVDSSFVVAARPNGRLWEASTTGIVYKTHQFRESEEILLMSPVSYRESVWVSDEAIENRRQSIQFSLLFPLQCNGCQLVLTYWSSRLLVVDVDKSRVTLVAEVGTDIADVSVCGTDVFVLLAGSAGLKKYSLFPYEKAVEKLLFKSAPCQAAQFVLAVRSEWKMSLIDRISRALSTVKKKESERLRSQLDSLMCARKTRKASIDDSHDNRSELLPSGVHRVHPDVSGYEDDFTFRVPSPLRQRSRSSPEGDHALPSKGKLLTKQKSLPVEMVGGERTDALVRAKQILDGDTVPLHGESLRTLLALDNVDALRAIRFTPTVTVASVARNLAELARVAPPVMSELLVERNDTRKGAKVVKAIRPRRHENVDVMANVAGGRTRNAERRDADQNNGWIEGELSCRPMVTRGRDTAEKDVAPDAAPHSPASRTTSEESDGHEGPPVVCTECLLHVSWLAVFLFGSALSSVSVTSDTFSDGGVPKDVPQWKMAMRHKLSTMEPPRDLCPKCNRAVEYARRMIGDGPFSDGLTAEGSRVDVERIRLKALAISDEILEEIIFGSDEQILPEYTFPLPSVSCAVEDVDYDPPSVVPPWLSLFSLHDLLVAARFSLDPPSFRAVIADGYISTRLTDDDWAFIVRLLSPRKNNNFLPQSTALSLLSEWGASRWISVGPPSPSKRTSTASSQWVVDVDGTCPLCSLPLKEVVGGVDQGLLSFPCGHCYHSICYGGRIGCLSCRIRNRRKIPPTPTRAAVSPASPLRNAGVRAASRGSASPR